MKSIANAPLLLLPVFLVIGVSVRAAESAPNTISKVAITNLLAHMEDYRGKRVEVVGYYRCAFELSALFQSKDDPTSIRKKRALWIELSVKPGHEKSVQCVKEGVVRIVGTFDYNVRQPQFGVGHLNGWRAQLVELEVLEEIK